MNAFSFGFPAAMARSDASTYSRGATCVRASVNGSARTSLTDHLRDDKESVAPGRRIAFNILTGHARMRLVLAKRCDAAEGGGAPPEHENDPLDA